MDAVLRGAAVYLALLLIVRLSGKRTLSQVTTFDFVLLLILSEATQQALLGLDYSITMAVLVIVTLIGLDRLADYLGWRFPTDRPSARGHPHDPHRERSNSAGPSRPSPRHSGRHPAARSSKPRHSQH